MAGLNPERSDGYDKTTKSDNIHSVCYNIVRALDDKSVLAIRAMDG